MSIETKSYYIPNRNEFLFKDETNSHAEHLKEMGGKWSAYQGGVWIFNNDHFQMVHEWVDYICSDNKYMAHNNSDKYDNPIEKALWNCSTQERQTLITERWNDLKVQHDIEWWSLVFSKRMRSTAGMCKYNKREICLAWELLNYKDSTYKFVMNTLLHEIGHALTPGHGHDKIWEECTLAIGGDGTKTHDMPFCAHKAKYIALCSANCKYNGFPLFRFRKSMKKGARPVKCRRCDHVMTYEKK